ncbi:unnamed protein product [Pichia kudriavzevii]
MQTGEWTRLSRQELHALHREARPETENKTNTDKNINKNKCIDINDTNSARNKVKTDAIREDSDSEDIDDFSMHNLQGIRTLRCKPEPDMLSNSSSSAASTVVHNPELRADDNELDAIQNGPLQTLETDPQLHGKLYRTLQLADADDTLDNDDTLGFNEDDDDNENENANANVHNNNSNRKYGSDVGYGYDGGNDEDEDDDDDDDDDDEEKDLEVDDIDFSRYMQSNLPSPPTSPPRELDPAKLYALYDFSGPDPSHLALAKNDSVLLLNDTDSYWWLVRRTDDGRIGFAPAEILETYTERLARLNCWKNEVLERGGYKGLKYDDEKKLFKTDYPIDTEKNRSNTSTTSITQNIERKGSLKKPKVIEMNNDSGSYLDDTIGNNAKKSVSFANINDTQEHSFLSIHEEFEEDESDSHVNHYDNSSLSLLNNYNSNPSMDDLVGNDNDTDANASVNNIDNDDYDGNENNKHNNDKELHDGNEQNVHNAIRHNRPNSSEGPCTGLVNTETDTRPLIVPKRRKNMFIKNLDNYSYSSENVDNIHSVGSVNSNNSACSKSESTRLESIKMLDDLLDMYPEFVSLDDGTVTPPTASSSSSPQRVAKPITCSNEMEILVKQGEDVGHTEDENDLHPQTRRLFGPLFSTMKELDALLEDIGPTA